MRTRASLVVDRVYRTDDGAYAVTPDCVGVFWFDTYAEVAEQYGQVDRIYSIEGIEDF